MNIHTPAAHFGELDTTQVRAQEEVSDIRTYLLVTRHSDVGLNSNGAVEALFRRVRALDREAVQALHNTPCTAYGVPSVLVVRRGVPRIIADKSVSE